MTSAFRPTGLALLLAAAALALLAGCGDSGGDSPEAVAEDFYAALEDEDAGAVCDLLSEESAQTAAEEEDADDCEAAFEKVIESGSLAQAFGVVGDIEIGEATEDGDTATVEVSAAGQSGSLQLIKEDGDWKVDL